MPRSRFGPVPFFNTRPERHVQSILRHAGIRFKTHVRALPGRPDIVVDDARLVIFVHGCFWHRHSCDKGRRLPRHGRRFWIEKFAHRVRRDQENLALLRSAGWRVAVVWECALNTQPHTIAHDLLTAVRSGQHPDMMDLEGSRDFAVEEKMTSAMNQRSSPVLWIVYAVLALVTTVAGFLAAARASTLDAAEARAAIADGLVQKAEAELSALGNQTQAAKTRLDSVRADLLPLEAQRSAVASDLLKAREDLGNAREASRAAETRRDEAEVTVKTLQGEQQGLRTQIQALEGDAAAARKAAEQSKLTAQAEANALQAVQHEVTDAKAELTRAQDELRQADAQRRTVQQDVLSVTSDLTRVQQDLAKAKSTISEASQLEGSVHSLTAKQADLQKAIDQAADQNARLEAEAAKASTSLSEKTASLAAMELRRQNVTSVIAASDKDIAQRKAELDSLKAESSHIESTNVTLSKTRSELQDQIGQLSRDVKAVAEERDSLRAEVAHLREQRTARLDEIGKLDEQRTRAQADSDALLAQRASLQKAVGELQVTRDQAAAEAVLNSRMAALSSALAEAIERFTGTLKQGTTQPATAPASRIEGGHP